jgi:hypothetical protein
VYLTGGGFFGTVDSQPAQVFLDITHGYTAASDHFQMVSTHDYHMISYV